MLHWIASHCGCRRGALEDVAHPPPPPMQLSEALQAATSSGVRLSSSA
jgi:hypothetical protein